jgi:type IV secretion system protein VirD4
MATNPESHLVDVRHRRGVLTADRHREDADRKKKAKASVGFGSGRWGTRADAQKAGLMTQRGIMLGTLDGYYLTDDRDTHVALFGETSSGKDVCHVLPTACMWDSSMVITDPKGGVTSQHTDAYRRSMSDVRVFAPLDAISERINILDTVDDFRSARAVANSLLAPAQMVRETPTSLHFRELAEVLLTGGMLHVLDTSARRSLAGVMEFFTITHETLEACLQDMIDTPHSDPDLHQLIASMAREIQKIKDRELSGVWTTTMRALHLFRDETLARNTDTSTVDLNDLQFGRRPMTLYLVSPSPEALAEYHPVYRVVLETIFRQLTSHPTGSYRHRLLCSLNEFPAYGYMPRVEAGAATLREYGIRLFLIAQDLEQLWNVYGKGTPLWGNLHTKLFHGAANDLTAKRVSEMLDTQTVQREVVSYHGGVLRRRASISLQEHARPLMTAGEVGQLPTDEAVLVISGQPPFRLKKVYWFKDAVFQGRIRPVKGGVA